MMKVVAAAFFLAVGPASAAPRTHTVVVGEHLWALAGRYYSNHFLWRRLEEANRAIIKDPHWIYPGQVLIIPDVDQLPPDPEAASFVPLAPAPVEASAPAPEPEVAAPAPVPVPKSRPRSKPMKFTDEMPDTFDANLLSSEIPGGMTSSPGDQARIVFPKGWLAHGEVVDTGEMDTFAVKGDAFEAKFFGKIPVSQGDRFVILRRSARPEGVPDEGRVFLQRVGEAAAREVLEGGKRRFVVLRAAGVVQNEDLLLRAEESREAGR